MKEAKFDALLVHVYSHPLKENPRPDIRGHLQVSAASHLYKEGRVSKLFIAGGHVFGEQRPALAHIMIPELIRKGVKSEDIIVVPVAIETSEEIEAFREEAEKQGWDKLASLANRAHLRRIRLIHQKANIQNIKRINAEDVLSKISKHYRTFINKFRNSPREMLFLVREAIVILPYYFGLRDQMAQLAKDSRIQRVKNILDR